MFPAPSSPGALPVPPLRPAAHQALCQLMQDTLTCVGTLDVTDQAELLSSLNLLDRLLAVVGQPLPKVQELGEALRLAGATLRPALAASLYRELAGFGRAYFGAALLLGDEPN